MRPPGRARPAGRAPDFPPPGLLSLGAVPILFRPMAENIIKVAQLHELPIKQDEDLVEMLSKVELDREIPDNLYKAVAEVFIFVYNATRK